MKRILIGMTVVLASWLWLPLIAMAQQMLVAKPLVVKKVLPLM